MSKPVTLKKFAAQIGGLSLELFAPAPHDCHLDFFRKLGESLGHPDSLHNIVSSPGSSRQLSRGKFACLKSGLRAFQLKAGLLRSLVLQPSAQSPHVKSRWLFVLGLFTHFHWLS